MTDLLTFEEFLQAVDEGVGVPVLELLGLLGWLAKEMLALQCQHNRRVTLVVT